MSNLNLGSPLSPRQPLWWLCLLLLFAPSLGRAAVPEAGHEDRGPMLMWGVYESCSSRSEGIEAAIRERLETMGERFIPCVDADLQVDKTLTARRASCHGQKCMELVPANCRSESLQVLGGFASHEKDQFFIRLWRGRLTAGGAVSGVEELIDSCRSCSVAEQRSRAAYLAGELVQGRVSLGRPPCGQPADFGAPVEPAATDDNETVAVVSLWPHRTEYGSPLVQLLQRRLEQLGHTVLPAPGKLKPTCLNRECILDWLDSHRSAHAARVLIIYPDRNNTIEGTPNPGLLLVHTASHRIREMPLSCDYCDPQGWAATLLNGVGQSVQSCLSDPCHAVWQWVPQPPIACPQVLVCDRMTQVSTPVSGAGAGSLARLQRASQSLWGLTAQSLLPSLMLTVLNESQASPFYFCERNSIRYRYCLAPAATYSWIAPGALGTAALAVTLAWTIPQALAQRRRTPTTPPQ